MSTNRIKHNGHAAGHADELEMDPGLESALMTAATATRDGIMERLPAEIAVEIGRAFGRIEEEIRRQVGKAVSQLEKELATRLAAAEHKLTAKVVAIESNFLAQIEGVKTVIRSLPLVPDVDVHIAAPPAPEVVLPADAIRVQVEATLQQPTPRKTTVEKSILYSDDGRPVSVIETTHNEEKGETDEQAESR